MKFGVNTFIWSESFDRSQLPLLPRVKAAGFDGVEVPLFQPAEFATEVIAKGLAENGLECTICSVLTGGLSMISEDGAVRKKTRVHMEDCVKTAADVGAKIIAGPLYSPVGYLPGRRRTADEWKWAVDCYQSLGPVLTQYGVTIAIEPLNRFETYFLNIADDAVALCDQIGHPNVGVLFDTFHANIEEKDIADAYRRVGRHLKHVHTCENDRGIPGSGLVDWEELFGALGKLHYDGYAGLESFVDVSDDMVAGTCVWRDLAPSGDVLVAEGTAFLRRLACENGL